MKNNIPAELTKSINALAKLPGVGRVSAKRAVLHMLQDKSLIANLVENLTALEQNITTCQVWREYCYIWKFAIFAKMSKEILNFYVL